MYLITFIDQKQEPFLSRRFDYENHFVEGMIVYDLFLDHYTRNGIDWLPLETDHL